MCPSACALASLLVNYNEFMLSLVWFPLRWSNILLACGLPRLLLSSILKCREGEFVVMIGMVCSSWVSVSRASTQRHFFVPLGNPERSASARVGNILVARTHAYSVIDLHLQRKQSDLRN